MNVLWKRKLVIIKAAYEQRESKQMISYKIKLKTVMNQEKLQNARRRLDENCNVQDKNQFAEKSFSDIYDLMHQWQTNTALMVQSRGVLAFWSVTVSIWKTTDKSVLSK